MSLPTVNGIGFLISDGVDLKFTTAGKPWARLPLSFKNRKRNADGTWTHDKEILIEGVVFGPLAEYLTDNVTGRQDLHVIGELYTEEYEGKVRVKMFVNAAAPFGAPKKPDMVRAGAAVTVVQDDDCPF